MRMVFAEENLTYKKGYKGSTEIPLVGKRENEEEML